MRLQLFAVALVIGSAAPAVALDPAIVANSIVRAYSDYCKPGHFETTLAPEAQWDDRLAGSYSRLLLTRYRMDCGWFMRSELFSATTTYGLLATMPELSRTGASELDENAINVLVGTLLLAKLTENCPSARERWIKSAEELLRMKLVRADAFRLGDAFSKTRVFLLDMDGYPTLTLDEPLPCTVAELVKDMVRQNALAAGIAITNQPEQTDGVKHGLLDSTDQMPSGALNTDKSSPETTVDGPGGASSKSDRRPTDIGFGN